MALDLGKFVAEIRAASQQTPWAARLALALNQVQDFTNQVASAIGVDGNGHVQPPAPPQAISVKAANGTVHVTLADNSQRSRALNYFVEADTDPNFGNPHVEQLAASRGKFFPLPGLTDIGDAQPWHFRAYSQYPGSSQRSTHVVFGSVTTPTPVTVGGTTQLTPLPSTGSGTASTNGQQKNGEGGFGSAQFARPTT